MREIFLTILNMGITSSYVILAIMLVRLCIRKLPKKFSYALWSVAAFRLCFPWSFSSIISFFNIKLFDMTVAQSHGTEQLTFVPSNIGTNISPTVSVGIPAINSVINDSIPESTQVVINGVQKTQAPLETATNIATAVWILGFAALFIYGVVIYIRTKLAMRTAVRFDGNVYESDKISSPFVLGFAKPKIYIPFGLDEEAKHYVLAHERYHIKRLDNIVKPIAFLILCVHWFNPLCWAAFVLMSRDMEMSCDEKVLSSEEGSGGAYSETLLSFAVNKRFPTPSPLAFGESSVKSRIKNALNFKKPRFWVSIIAVILCVVTVVACAANPISENGAYKDRVTGIFGMGDYIYKCSDAGEEFDDGLDFCDLMAIREYGENITLWNYGIVFVTGLDGKCSSSVTPYLISEFERFSLTRENFDKLFGKYKDIGDWKSGFSATFIRNRNIVAWRYTYFNDFGGEDFYYILLQEDGSVYIVSGKTTKSSQDGYYINIAKLDIDTIYSDMIDQIMEAIERAEGELLPLPKGNISPSDTIETAFECTEYVYYDNIGQTSFVDIGTYCVGRDENNYRTLYKLVTTDGVTRKSKCATLQKVVLEDSEFSDIFDSDFTWKNGYSLGKIISENKEAYIDAFYGNYYVLLQNDGTILLASRENYIRSSKILAAYPVENTYDEAAEKAYIQSITFKEGEYALFESEEGDSFF